MRGDEGLQLGDERCVTTERERGVETPFESDEASRSWVAPVERAGGIPAVLKVGPSHMESEHEIEGLRFWDGATAPGR